MVRRWSYINQLNVLHSREIRATRIGSSNTLINSLMFLRRRFMVLTKANRKGWARRIHTNDLMFLTNVLIGWAKEYRFYRNYLRSTHYQFFSKNTYLTLNLTLSKSLLFRYSKSNVSGLGSGLHRRTIRYFMNFHTFSRMGFLARFYNYCWSVTSFPLHFSQGKELFNSTLHYPYASVLGCSALGPTSTSPSAEFSLIGVLNIPYRLHQAWLVALYSFLVKIFMVNLKL